MTVNTESKLSMSLEEIMQGEKGAKPKGKGKPQAKPKEADKPRNPMEMSLEDIIKADKAKVAAQAKPKAKAKAKAKAKTPTKPLQKNEKKVSAKAIKKASPGQGQAQGQGQAKWQKNSWENWGNKSGSGAKAKSQGQQGASWGSKSVQAQDKGWGGSWGGAASGKNWANSEKSQNQNSWGQKSSWGQGQGKAQGEKGWGNWNGWGSDKQEKTGQAWMKPKEANTWSKGKTGGWPSGPRVGGPPAFEGYRGQSMDIRPAPRQFSVKVRNMPETVSAKDVKQAFEDSLNTKVLDCWVDGTGIATLSFSSRFDAEETVRQYHNGSINQRTVTVERLY